MSWLAEHCPRLALARDQFLADREAGRVRQRRPGNGRPAMRSSRSYRRIYFAAVVIGLLTSMVLVMLGAPGGVVLLVCLLFGAIAGPLL